VPDRSGLLTFPDVAASRVFPPSAVTEVKAAACDNAGARAKGLSYYSIRDLAKLVMQKLSLVTLAPSTVWDILDQDAIKPWQYRSWIFPRDPVFAKYANVVLDLYQGCYMGEPLGERDFVFSGDEKPGLLIRTRCRPTVLPTPGKAGLIEFEYRRHGTATLLALLEISSGVVFHQTVAKSGIVPFKKLIDQLLEQERYRNAKRIFLIVDNGSSHGRKRFQERLSEWFPQPDYPEIIAVHTPKHASWLNQVEIFFSIVARKALPHVQCRSRDEMVDHIERFIATHNETPVPFNWRFTKDDLEKRMKKWPNPIPN
jgi:transposase